MENLQILILDDEEKITRKLFNYLRESNYDAFTASAPKEAFDLLAARHIDILILDVMLPQMNGLEFLKKAKKEYPALEVIMISGHGDMDIVIHAMQEGATDFIKKPFGFVDIEMAIRRTGKYLHIQNSLSAEQSRNSLISRELEGKIEKECIGNSDEMKKVLEMAMRVAGDRDANVLITGENGSGKEIIARIIHHASKRSVKSFYPVNCSAIPETLLESEFFGHRKGSFTDARESRRGLFELASGGTLFLDEIADMPVSLQAKLLRALEEKKIKQVGSESEFAVDVRLISATNRDVGDLIHTGRFRMDLFHRINTFIIHIPPLRDRRDDIDPLLQHFVNSFARKKKRQRPKVDRKVREQLNKYDFPGNIRELRNMVERAMILCPDHILKMEHFATGFEMHPAKDSKPDLNLEKNEVMLIRTALVQTGYNQKKAATLLGISRDALIRRMRKYRMQISKNMGSGIERE